jgi:hypothetical protein
MRPGGRMKRAHSGGVEVTNGLMDGSQARAVQAAAPSLAPSLQAFTRPADFTQMGLTTAYCRRLAWSLGSGYRFRELMLRSSRLLPFY